MERAEKVGLGVAVAGHIVLFGLLSVGFLATPNPVKLEQHPIDVSLATEASLESQAPQITQEPAQSVAPEQGAPEEAPPAAAAPEPAPAPEPQPVPQPAPEPKPAPQKPAPAKPAAKPEPKPVPQPKPKPAPKAEPAPAKPTREAAAKPAKAAPAAAKSAPTKTASNTSSSKTSGSDASATKTRTRGSRLGDDFLKGITDQPSKSQTPAPRAAKVGARDLASIAGLIRRQVQPCYDLGPLAGTSAMDITTVLRLQFRRDGSVAAATVSDQTGVNAENRSYAKQMAELSRRAVLRCSPLRGLPPDLYEGGWADFDMGFIPRQLG